MKNKFQLLFILFFLTINLQAQNNESASLKNALKVSPFAFAASKFQVSYERTFKEKKHSLMLTPAIILKDNGVESKKGFETMLQYRIILTQLRKGTNKTMRMHSVRFYTGPYANGLLYSENYQNGYYDKVTETYLTKVFTKEVYAIEGGVLIGIQFDVTKRIILDFYAGGGVRYSDVDDEYEDYVQEDEYNFTDYGVFEMEYTGIKPKLGMQLGFSF